VWPSARDAIIYYTIVSAEDIAPLLQIGQELRDCGLDSTAGAQKSLRRRSKYQSTGNSGNWRTVSIDDIVMKL
jgi:hypothetical protein